MQLMLFVAYPILAHLAVMLGLPALQWLALQALFAALYLAPLRDGQPRTWLAWAAFAIGVAALAAAGGGRFALYLPPLALLGLALSAFALSLRPGATPLVTRIAEAARGPQPSDIRAHTHAVTWIWLALLGSLFAITLYFTVFGPKELWSLMTNFLNYVLMGLMFALEYGYRRLRFPDHDRDGFLAYLRLVVRHRGARP